ncbi:uncharacterized protein LOC121178203 [Toxotes jaculatrix]|uniref:uncharacterized protein LOC121178203 n=1 Tax=Toxotes jaculatrix TaxID=941984 RepID=UPI001B3AA718|nr:uncharacterized protein LOC121178203 [Toxotes jaculatrix]
MGRWKLWFVLLLLPISCIDTEETQQQLVKITGKEPYETPVCTNDTHNSIVIIVCAIRTERHWTDNCQLLYRFDQGFENKCDSRFKLMSENQTGVLHLTRLTSEDSGNYTCQCSHALGTHVQSFNITVEGDENDEGSAEISFPFVEIITAVTVFIIITGAILGFTYRKNHHKRQIEPMTRDPNMEPGDVEPYSTFIQRENGLYSVATVHWKT